MNAPGTIDLRDGMPVDCADGPCGQVVEAIVNPRVGQVTHLVVSEKRAPQSERLVPLEDVAAAGPEVIRLRNSAEELAKMEQFVREQTVQIPMPPPPDTIMGPDYGMWLPPFPSSEEAHVPEEQEPAGGRELRPGAEVRAIDGRVGQVAELVVEPQSGRLDQLVLTDGHGRGRKGIVIPANEIARIADHIVHLKLSKQQIEVLATQPEQGQQRAAVQVNQLVRKFGNFTAVKGISFNVNPGEVFGFLGPNGAGKSTTINMLVTLLRPTSGTAFVNGFNVATHPDAVRQSIGVIFQDPSLDDRLTGYENLRFHAMLYGVPGQLFKERADELLGMVELSDKAHEIVRNYSGGMKRRLEIARGLLHRPKVLFLDEPTVGLDPQTRRHIWDYVFKLRAQEGVTVFMTTHYMDEAENCDRIAVIDHGEIVALDSPNALKALVGGDIITVRTADNERAVEKIRGHEGVEARLGPEGEVVVEVQHGDQFIPRMMQVLADTGEPVQVQSVNLRRPTLEDVFIKLTGRAIREEEAGAKEQLRMRTRMWRR